LKEKRIPARTLQKSTQNGEQAQKGQVGQQTDDSTGAWEGLNTVTQHLFYM